MQPSGHTLCAEHIESERTERKRNTGVEERWSTWLPWLHLPAVAASCSGSGPVWRRLVSRGTGQLLACSCDPCSRSKISAPIPPASQSGSRRPALEQLRWQQRSPSPSSFIPDTGPVVGGTPHQIALDAQGRRVPRPVHPSPDPLQKQRLG